QGQWTTHEKHFVKLERKRAREQEKQQELLANAEQVLAQQPVDTLSAEGTNPSDEAEATSVFAEA
ncbi:hypothetical protein Q4595_29825, partial [Wenyingzhuangia sp. 1_MG-2023]|nr:hypothetical protein [Wenyingzhuangia sp. 1_MG-2023]